MSIVPDLPVLECQDCGTRVRTLSAAEAQMVADNPHNFIVYCYRCQKALEQEFYDG